MCMKYSKVTLNHVFKNIIWPRRRPILAGLLLIFLSRISSLVLPGASQHLMDDVIINKNTEMLKNILLFVIGAITIQAITSFLLTKILSIEAQHLIAKLRVQVQKKVMYLPTRFFDNTKSGELVSRIMSDVEGVRNLVGTGLVQLVGGVLTSFISLALMIRISPLMTIYVFVPLAIFGIISLKAFGYIRPIFRERGKINAEVTGRLTETLNGIRVIKGFNAEKQEIKTFEEGTEKLFLNVKKSLTASSIVTSSATFLLGLSSTGIMGIGGYMIMNDDLTIGEFLSFTLYLGFMIAPIIQMSNIGSQITEAFAGLDRTQELMNMKSEVNGSFRTHSIKNIEGYVQFNNVAFGYKEEKKVLHNISFDVQPGSVTALVGSSGSGKSTIAALAASFIIPNSGTITVDRHDLSLISLENFRSQLGVVLQDDFLFEGTIKENILFPKPKATDAEVTSAANAAYITEFTDQFEEGLETVIGERGIKLSGGQRQRIAIARAILANPRILILDEATSNLDTESESYIQKSLENLMSGRTTLVIAHRLSTIRRADQILVIEGGVIAEKGTHNDLIDKEGRYFELHTYQARI